jgi:hypothetical protein
MVCSCCCSYNCYYIYIYEYTVDSSSYYSISFPDIEAALLIAINHDQS